MDKYIKREEAIRNIASITARYAEDLAMKSLCLNALLATPTANVVPRADVARIFEEIERLLDNHHSACHPVGAIEAYTYYEGGLGDAIADLKKKYESEGAE